MTKFLFRLILLAFLGSVGLLSLSFGSIAVASIWDREKITVEKRERTFRVYVPPSYSDTRPVPLVLVFHNLTTTGKTAEWLTRFDQIAEREGFIVAYPDGYRGSWAEGSNLYAADQSQVNDVLFTAALIQKLSMEYAIDPNRIYATGFSSGGFMVQRLGCELANKITAIATVGATVSRTVLQACNTGGSMPVLMIHGTGDQGVPWEGDEYYASIPDTVEHWAVQNGCSTTPLQSLEPDWHEDGTTVQREAYVNCASGSDVILYTIIGGGHTWPGGSETVQLWGLNGKISQELDASQRIWQFFEAQDR